MGTMVARTLLRIAQILFFVLLLPTHGFGQTQPPYRFYDLPFGTPLASVEARLKSEYTIVLRETGTEFSDVFVARGMVGEFDGRATFFFCDGALCRVALSVESEKSRFYRSYLQMKAALVERYGPPQADVERYSYPFEKGDGRAETAIASGRAELLALWKPDSEGNTLSTSLEKNGLIIVLYETPKADEVHENERQRRRRRL
jgi:hypothetical protein